MSKGNGHGGLPIAADGMPLPGPVGVGIMSAAPAATPENFICLRGPCRHYWTLQSDFGAGNPDEMWEELERKPPVQIHHFCLVSKTETELTEDCVSACNRWDPMQPDEITALEARRAAYYAANPTTPEND